MKLPLNEEDVLKPVSPTIADDNDWPVFQVLNVEVRGQSSGELENLLSAGDSHTLSVTGKLERLERSHNKYLKIRDAIPTPIQISGVERFAYGQFEDGEVAFWAAGKAGWFEIRPSRRYRQIYKDMTDAINLLYFAADFYLGMKARKLRQTPARDVFLRYSQDSLNKCKDESTAQAKFQAHQAVLRRMMRDGKEGINWENTRLLEFLDRETPEPSAAPADALMATPDATSGDEDDLPARLAGKGKSTLRLKGGGLSGKAAARQAALALNGGHSDQDTDGTPTLKRKSAADIPVPPKKRGRPPKASAQYTTRLEDSSQLDDDEVAAEDDEELAKLPIRSAPSKTKPGLPNTQPPSKFEVELVNSPLPSFAPNLPGDVWRCGYDGCSHKVFAASTEQSHELISEHYKKHAYECQAAIDLVQKEERPYLPVSHLMKRIRDMAAARTSGSDSAPSAEDTGSSGKLKSESAPIWLSEASSFPQPIRQRY